MSRHVDLREMAHLGHIRCTYIPTANQRADVMTKSLLAQGFRRMRDWLGVFPAPLQGVSWLVISSLAALQLASIDVCFLVTVVRG